MAGIYYLPFGPKNLQALFSGVDWSQVEDYYLEARDASNNLIATTTTNRVTNPCEDEVFRLHFVNNLGGVDAINARLVTHSVDVKSDSFTKGAPVPFEGGVHVKGRDALTETETFELCIVADEGDLSWIRELVETPLSWREWKGVDGQTDSYQPIVISPMAKYVQKRKDDSYQYEITISFTLSQEKVLLRN